MWRFPENNLDWGHRFIAASLAISRKMSNEQFGFFGLFAFEVGARVSGAASKNRFPRHQSAGMLE